MNFRPDNLSTKVERLPFSVWRMLHRVVGSFRFHPSVRFGVAALRNRPSTYDDVTGDSFPWMAGAGRARLNIWQKRPAVHGMIL